MACCRKCRKFAWPLSVLYAIGGLTCPLLGRLVPSGNLGDGALGDVLLMAAGAAASAHLMFALPRRHDVDDPVPWIDI